MFYTPSSTDISIYNFKYYITQISLNINTISITISNPSPKEGKKIVKTILGKMENIEKVKYYLGFCHSFHFHILNILCLHQFCLFRSHFILWLLNYMNSILKTDGTQYLNFHGTKVSLYFVY